MMLLTKLATTITTVQTMVQHSSNGAFHKDATAMKSSPTMAGRSLNSAPYGTATTATITTISTTNRTIEKRTENVSVRIHLFCSM